jgi:Helix-turn-helix.
VKSERFNMNTFERIKDLADKQGKSLQKVSEDLGFSTNYIYQLKNSKSPSVVRLSSIADYFNVSLNYLLSREDKRKINLHARQESYPQMLDEVREMLNNDLSKGNYSEIDYALIYSIHLLLVYRTPLLETGSYDEEINYKRGIYYVQLLDSIKSLVDSFENAVTGAQESLLTLIDDETSKN